MAKKRKKLTPKLQLKVKNQILKLLLQLKVVPKEKLKPFLMVN
jgi:hypothetical protein